LEGGWSYHKGDPRDFGIPRLIRIEKVFAKAFLQGCFFLTFLAILLVAVTLQNVLRGNISETANLTISINSNPSSYKTLYPARFNCSA